MRICLFTPTFFPEMGGVEMWCDTFARGMIARGHHVVVLAQKMRGNRPMPALPYAVENYHRPPAQHLLAELLSFPLRRSHRQHHFDVVVTNYGYPLAYAASRVKERLGLGLVSVAHGSDLYDGFHALRKPRVKKLIRLGYQRCDQIAAVSQSMAARVHQCIGNCPTPVTVIENAVDIAALRFPANAPPPPVAAELSLTPGHFTIQVAGLRRVKRQDLSIAAALENKTFLEHSNLKHVLVGQGALDADYKQLVAQNNLQNRVLFAGLRTGSGKAWLFSNARFLINSSDEEGHPSSSSKPPPPASPSS
jgi:L-malate glycosyltransferase